MTDITTPDTADTGSEHRPIGTIEHLDPHTLIPERATHHTPNLIASKHPPHTPKPRPTHRSRA